MSFNCNKCKKQYVSYQSLWKHNKTYHSNKINTSINTNIQEIKHKCKFCDKEFNSKQSKCRHQLHFCKNIPLIEKPSTPSNQSEIDLLKKEVNELKQLINKKEGNNINKGQIINNNVNVNNNIKIELGVEDIKKLTQDQKLNVLKSIIFGEYPIITLVSELNKNEQNRNIKIPNIHDKYALKYDSQLEKFTKSTKKEVVNDIISVRKHDIKSFFEEFCDGKHLTVKVKNAIEKYLDKLFNSSENDIELKKFIDEHKEKIILIIYNITMIDNEDKSMEI